jgi:deoxyguanosine kinase
MSYIVVEGPIGAGQTRLSRMLAEELQARLVLEVVEENPFLAPFYADPEGYGFKVQVFFLLSRYKQLQDLAQGALFYPHTVSDYLFDKDFIFASINLRGAEWELYQDLYQQLRPKLTEPDLVVHLRASPNLLLKRIAKRARSFEQNMEASYLRRLGEAYDEYFSHYQGEVYTIEAADYDFVENKEDREQVVSDILNLSKAA